MPRQLTAKVVEEMASRLSDIDANIAKLDKAIEDATLMDQKSGRTRSMSIILGVPCGMVAFVFLGFFFSAFDGRGLYFGIGFACATYVLSKIGLSTPKSLVPAIDSQRNTLMVQRKKFQDQIQSYSDELEKSTQEHAV